MTYSSSLKDREWEVLEPVLQQALPPGKRHTPEPSLISVLSA
jgi:hypothetical protein